ncbi:hypothetical protein D3C79_1106110 [compost metagenome]
MIEQDDDQLLWAGGGYPGSPGIMLVGGQRIIIGKHRMSRQVSDYSNMAMVASMVLMTSAA